MAETVRVDRRRFLTSLLAAPLAGRLGAAGAVGASVQGARSRFAAQRSRDHVVVIGAGAFGGWTALSLLRAGARVTLVDAWGAGNSRASSGGETRVIRAAYGGERVYIEMAARAFTLWRDAEKQWGRQILTRTGALWMFSDDDSYVRRSIEPMKSVGLTVEEMSPAEALRRYPQISFAGVRTAFFEPEAGYLTARQACELVRESVVREGGDYQVAWVRPGIVVGGQMKHIVLSNGSTVEADRFVFACGPWLGQVFPGAVGRRIVATRQEVFFFGVPAGNTRYETGTLPVWLHFGDRIFYGVPGNERRGFKVADDTAGDEVEPTNMDRQASPAALARARAFLGERFPGLAEAPLVETRVCQYEAASDGNYLVDRHPELDNVWLLGGGSGHGFKMGPALGEHVAALVQGRAKPHPLFAHQRLRPHP